MITAKERAIRLIGEENVKILEKSGIVVKEKHVHRTHQSNRYTVTEKPVIGKVVDQYNITYEYVDQDNHYYEIITNSNGRYIFTKFEKKEKYVECSK